MRANAPKSRRAGCIFSPGLELLGHFCPYLDEADATECRRRPIGNPGRELFGYFCPHLDSQIADSDTKMFCQKFERVRIWPFPHPFAKATSSRRPSERDGSTERVLFSGFSAPFQMEQALPARAETFLRCRFATLHGQTLRKASAPAELYIMATVPSDYLV